MNDADQIALENLFATLWTRYLAITPDAARIHALLAERGETFRNDHVALRTFACGPVGLERLAEPFCARGYVESGRYRFAQKRLNARSYRHPAGALPRVFISELELGSFSPAFRELVERVVQGVSAEEPAEQLLTGLQTWPAIRFADYQKLLAESDYAAWVATFGLRVNHFTVHFNDLKTFSELSQLNAFLEQSGFQLNGEAQKVQGGPSALLEQSSTVAASIPWAFEGGEERHVPGGYYEFARRYVDPQTGTIFEGFVAASADKIFESTDVRSARDRSGERA